MVLHHCDNRKCSRPDHLYIGGAKENTMDAISRSRYVPPAGVINGSAKIDEQMVLDIRDRYRRGEQQKTLAKEYGVDQSNISLIVTRKTWGHL